MNQDTMIVSGQVINYDTWYRLLATLSLTGGQARVYLDNVLVIDHALPGGFSLEVINAGVENDRKITLQHYGNGSAFHGWFDEMRIYKGIVQP